jgi:hypothetical protein
MIRAMAKAGHAGKTVASSLDMSLGAVMTIAVKNKIPFAKLSKSERAAKIGGEMAAEAATYWPKMQEIYKEELKREIEAAKREAPYAKPYKPASDRNGNPL